jgi:hypothetical protein
LNLQNNNQLNATQIDQITYNNNEQMDSTQQTNNNIQIEESNQLEFQNTNDQLRTTLQSIIAEIQNQFRTETAFNYNDLMNDNFEDQANHFEHQIGGSLHNDDHIEFLTSTQNDENQTELNLQNNNQLNATQIDRITDNNNEQMDSTHSSLQQTNNNVDEFIQQHTDNQIEESNQLEFENTNDQFSFSTNDQSIDQIGGSIPQDINFEFIQTDCKEYSNTKFKIKETIYNIKLKELEGLTFPQALVKMENLFQYIHSNFVQSLQQDQKIRLIINHSLFDYAISIHCMNRDDMTVDIIKNRFSSQVQSYKNVEDSAIKNNHQMTINVLVFDTITGGSNEFNEFLHETASIKV